MREKRRYPRGREGTDATVSRIREKRWKERKQKREERKFPNEREKEKKNLSKGGTDHQTHKTRSVIVKVL